MLSPIALRRSRPVRGIALVGLMCIAITWGGTAWASNRLANNGHWERNGTAVAQVYFVDHTGTMWPVNASVNDWNQAAQLGAYYLSPSDNCPFHCVDVREIDNESAQYYGATFALDVIDSNNHFTGNVHIKLNNFYGRQINQSKRQSVACQEEGHAVGLDHAMNTSSCMWPDSSMFPLHPSDHDYHMINDIIYDH